MGCARLRYSASAASRRARRQRSEATRPPSPGTLAPDFTVLFPEQPLAPPSGPVYFYSNGQPIPPGLALPRKRVMGRQVIDERWEVPQYPQGREGLGLLPNTKAVPNRWFVNYPHWQRYMDVSTETPYQYDTPRLFHPYQQSTLKGDVPIVGDDIFLDITAKDFTLFEFRKDPTPSGVSAATPNESEFFGRSSSALINSDFALTLELFKGETSFKPVNWALRLTGIYNQNWIWVNENNLLSPDPRGPDYPDRKGNPNTGRLQAIPGQTSSVNPQGGIPGNFTKPVNPGDAFNYLQGQLTPLGTADSLQKVDPLTGETVGSRNHSKKGSNDLSGSRYTERYRDSFALQEAFAEIHFSDLSNNYDFISSRSGIQPFVSDFRGFIFSDTNLGFRLFGNLDNNRVQYNLAYFDMLEKDTFSGLNTFTSRRQQVIIANVYKQDFIWKGYTSQFSFHANLDDGGTHYDRIGFLTRPEPIGTVRTTGNSATGQLRGKEVDAFYFGWAGDGHIGRLNINHAFYQVFGQDEFNELAGRRLSINAQMAALELSLDRDWVRFKLTGFYASGDSKPTDGTARGFSAIADNPFFIGGPFSWYSHQGFNLAGTAVDLKSRDSLVPDLRTSKTEGQANFDNPGVFILGLGTDADITPKLKGFLNANYIWFAQTQPLQTALMSNKISDQFGWDLSVGFRYRPLLTDNIIISAGVGFFLPGEGYRSIYRTSTSPVPGYGTQDAGKVDDFLYNAFFTVSLTY